MDADHNVGIGTTDPLELLHVAGSVRSDASLRSIAPTGDGEVFLGWGVDGNGDDMARIRIGGASPGGTNGLDIQRTSNVSLMRILNSGNVGIGTSTPLYPLHVESVGGRSIFAKDTANVGVGGWFESDGTSGTGVLGRANHSSGINFGVIGQSSSPNGYDFYALGPGTDYGSSSSIRWKHNVEPIGDPLLKLAQLRGVYYDWDKEHGGGHDVGMIAEEVGKVLPEIVNYEENGVDAIGMDYSKMTPLLVEAVNALRAEKNAEIARQRVEIANLAERLDRMEAMLKRLVEK